MSRSRMNTQNLAAIAAVAAKIVTALDAHSDPPDARKTAGSTDQQEGQHGEEASRHLQILRPDIAGQHAHCGPSRKSLPNFAKSLFSLRSAHPSRTSLD